jgi:hypothetical protein
MKEVKLLAVFMMKYLMYFLLLLFCDDRYSIFISKSATSGSEMVLNLWNYVLFTVPYCVFFSFLFFYPFCLSFKVRNLSLGFLLFLAALCIEYYGYTYLASQLNAFNGLLNGLLTMVLMLVFYLREYKNVVKLL